MMVIARISNLLGKVTILVMVSFVVNTAAALDGSGTQEDPWLIQSLEDFNDFSANPNYWDDYTRLETDVNLAGQTYSTAIISPDMNSARWFQGFAFTGVFDGNDHKITNLTIDDGATGNDYLGLFGYIYDGEIRNLTLEGGSVSGTGNSVGGLVARNVYGTISKCCSSGNVNGHTGVGGLVGINIYGTVSNCHSTCNVNSIFDIGGLVGGNIQTSSLSNCYSTGDVSGIDSVGGLVGVNYKNSTVSDCYSTSNVSGNTYAGGLVGRNYLGGTVSNCFWDTDRQTHGVTESFGYNYVGTVTNVTGLSTVQMQTKSIFTSAGWDFVDIWLINNGVTYPVLRREIRSDLNSDGGINFLDLGIFANQWMQEQ